MIKTSRRADLVAREALRLCGSAFRIHGRDAGHGLDCIGLCNLCLIAAGRTVDPPSGYALRGGSIRRIAMFMTDAGFETLPAESLLDVGDIVLVQPAKMQLHFMINTRDGFVHAHAGLRKVVLSPGPIIWPIISIFRL